MPSGIVGLWGDAQPLVELCAPAHLELLAPQFVTGHAHLAVFWLAFDQDRNTFAAAMEKFVTNTGLSAKYGKPARKRVIANFSFNAFTNQLTKIVDEAAK